MSGLSRHRQNISLTVASGQTTTAAFHVGDMAWGSVQLPASLTSTAMSYLVSNDNVTFDALRDSAGDAIAATTVASGRIVPIPDEVFNHGYAKIVLGSSEGADRSLNVLVKG